MGEKRNEARTVAKVDLDDKLEKTEKKKVKLEQTVKVKVEASRIIVGGLVQREGSTGVHNRLVSHFINYLESISLSRKVTITWNQFHCQEK